jgi:hypothetical protein
MVTGEDSGELSRNAAEVLENVRRAQAESQKPLFGTIRLSRERKALIHQISSTDPAIIDLREGMSIEQSVTDNMFERFEEMCRRRKIVIADELYPAVLERLATELKTNAQALNSPPGKLTSATIYSGAFAPGLVDGYPEFRESPGIYRDAARQFPMNPAGYLKRLRETIAEVSADSRFSLFADNPSIYREASRKHPADTAEFLGRAVKTYHEIMGENEFAMFHDTPGIVKEAVIDHVKDSRAFLRGVTNTADSLAFDEAFAEFWKPQALAAAKAAREEGKTDVKIPSIFKRAAANYVGGTRDFLLGVKSAMAELAADDEFADFRKTPAIFKLASIRNPRDPREFLRGVRKNVSDFSKLEEYAELQLESPGSFRQAAIHYSADPSAFLDRQVKKRGASHASEVGAERDDTGGKRR